MPPNRIHHGGRRPIDLSGRKINRWTALYRSTVRTSYWICRCECGTVCEVNGANLRSNKTKSCGCLNREVSAQRGRDSATHGMTETSEFMAWIAMIQRCENPANGNYHRYGARGIRICGRWRDSFEAFYTDMGPRPSSGHSIDRIDNDGNYEPGNCRWATWTQQGRNKRTSRFVEYRGELILLIELAESVGIHRSTIDGRLKRGWTLEDAVRVPVLSSGDFFKKGRRCKNDSPSS